MKILDYVYYRIDDYYRRNPRWQGGAIGGYRAAIVMAGVGMVWAVDVMFSIWHMIIRVKSSFPTWFKPTVIMLFLLLVLILGKRYVPIRMELRSRYFGEVRDSRWRRKGYLITFIILLSVLYAPLMIIVFGKVVHIPQH